MAVLPALVMGFAACSQSTFPTNGPATKPGTVLTAYAHANIITQPGQMLTDATLLVLDERIVAVGTGIEIPANAVVIDVQGKYIYPSFIDLSSDYGMPEMAQAGGGWGQKPQYKSMRKTTFGWNEAIKSDFGAASMFAHDSKKASELRQVGFGAVFTHRKDGISRGTGALVILGRNETADLLVPDAGQAFSFRKGSSKQAYPSSLVGSVALLRQTLYDARWYHANPGQSETNLTLDALRDLDKKTLFFEAAERYDMVRAAELAKEFGIQFICRGNGDEYRAIEALKATGQTLVIPVSFPAAFDVSDPHAARMISLAELKHWELAPFNPALLHQSGIQFCLTSDGLREKKEFLSAVAKAIEHGLPEDVALAALTTLPAKLMKAENEIGTLAAGKRANFFISSKPVFSSGAAILEHHTNGQPDTYKALNTEDIAGTYHFTMKGKMYDLEVTGTEEKPKATVRIIEGKDTLKSELKINRDLRNIAFTFLMPGTQKGTVRASGNINRQSLIWDGKAEMPDGTWADWVAVRQSKGESSKEADAKPKTVPVPPVISYPLGAFGRTKKPEPGYYHIKNATVWTCEDTGILTKADVLVAAGKIVAVGENLRSGDYFPKLTLQWTEIDATGKHLSPGIIDEHSHIALTRGVNESAQASSAEVRMGDAIDSEDIDIYRQLGGGVTAAQLLHGSSNPIGGQSALVKLRWGSTPAEMKIDSAAGFIKFALGENVKQANWGDYERERYPQTRMGVEQVYYDHFHRAKEYGQSWLAYSASSVPLSKKDIRKGATPAVAPRVDLDLQALWEILDKRRFITCHSYVQSEINMLMHVADSMNFTVNTFTHILEGYKVADKMKEHGAGGSSFSDWWAYKFEVKDAIPHNGALLWEQGVVTAFNSDDAEMARRLNQEAGKAVKYGNVPEAEALKFVTLNPAKLLHLDHRMGSVKAGKDADLVLWTDNPLSIYAKVEKTFVDGVVLFDATENRELEKQNQAERSRLIQKMLEAAAGGAETRKPAPGGKRYYCCDTIEDFLRTEDCEFGHQTGGFE